MASIKLDENDPDKTTISCPICNNFFKKTVIEEHANKCLFLNTSEQSKLKQNKLDPPNNKRSSSHFNNALQEKRARISTSPNSVNTLVSSKFVNVLVPM